MTVHDIIKTLQQYHPDTGVEFVLAVLDNDGRYEYNLLQLQHSSINAAGDKYFIALAEPQES